MPNHAGRMVVYSGGEFKVVRECYDIESSYLDPIREQERKLNLTN
jgi:branched-chain amino acid transport system substrate-binding protein